MLGYRAVDEEVEVGACKASKQRAATNGSTLILKGAPSKRQDFRCDTFAELTDGTPDSVPRQPLFELDRSSKIKEKFSNYRCGNARIFAKKAMGTGLAAHAVRILWKSFSPVRRTIMPRNRKGIRRQTAVHHLRDLLSCQPPMALLQLIPTRP
jgi:hypothetical protein